MTEPESAPPDVQILNNSERSRYELHLDGVRIGLADYYERDGAVVIPHTETLPQYGGRGFAGRLVRYALDDITAQGKRVVPSCPFVAAFIRRNPEYARLLA